MEAQFEEVKAQFEKRRLALGTADHGVIIIDVTDSIRGAAVAQVFDKAERALRRGVESQDFVHIVREAQTELDAYIDEAARQNATLLNALERRNLAEATVEDLARRFNDLEAVVEELSSLQGNSEVRDLIRLAGSGLRYAKARLSITVSAAWVLNTEIDSEQKAVEDARLNVEDLEALLSVEQDRSARNDRGRKLAQSTLELALSKLEGLARSVSDSGVQKEPEVLRVMESTENAYLLVKHKLGLDEGFDPSSARAVIEMINGAEAVAARAVREQQQRARDLQAAHARVQDLALRLASVTAVCNASGSLVMERVQTQVDVTQSAVAAAVRLSRRDALGAAFESSVEAASESLIFLEKHADQVKAEVSSAEASFAAARTKIDNLSQSAVTARNRANECGIESARGLAAVFGDADAAISLCKASMAGVQSWLQDPTMLSALMEDATSKVELAEEEVNRHSERWMVAKKEQEGLAARLGNLVARHEKICQVVQQLKTSPPPRLVQAIAATDKSLAEALSGKHSIFTVSLIEGHVREEEDISQLDIHASEKRLVDLEKAATQVPLLLQKLAWLDAQVEAAGVHAAELVEGELGEAHRAVRSLEHALDTDVASPTASCLLGVSDKVKAAENAVSTQIRRISNAFSAQQDAKAQLISIQRSFDELNESSAILTVHSKSTDYHFDGVSGIAGEAMGVNSTSVALSARVVVMALKRCEQLVAHARRRIEVPIAVWLEYGPVMVQAALDGARESVQGAKALVDAEQSKLDSSGLERRSAHVALEDCTQTLISLRAKMSHFSGSPDTSSAEDAINAADHAVDVALRVLARSTVSSALAAMEIATKKTADAEAQCASAIEREDAVDLERNRIREQYQKIRERMESSKEAAMFLNLGDSAVVADALSAADRTLIGLDLVIRCEFGLPMLRKEFQAGSAAVDDFVRVVEREKARVEAEQTSQFRLKHEERLRHQEKIEAERLKSAEERLERRLMQDKLEAAIHRLQLHWPSVVDVQNMMSAAETSVEAARAKLSSGGLVAANAAVSMALKKVQSLEHTAKMIESSSSYVEPKDRSDATTNSFHHNLREIQEQISKQNQIMAIQSKLIMASTEEQKESLRRDLMSLQG